MQIEKPVPWCRCGSGPLHQGLPRQIRVITRATISCSPLPMGRIRSPATGHVGCIRSARHHRPDLPRAVARVDRRPAIVKPPWLMHLRSLKQHDANARGRSHVAWIPYPCAVSSPPTGSPRRAGFVSQASALHEPQWVHRPPLSGEAQGRARWVASVKNKKPCAGLLSSVPCASAPASILPAP